MGSPAPDAPPGTSWLLWGFYLLIIAVLVYFIVCAVSTVWSYAAAPPAPYFADKA